MRQLHTQWKELIGAGLLVVATGALIYHFRSASPSRTNQESAESVSVEETQAIDLLEDYSQLSRSGLVPEGFLDAIRTQDQDAVEAYLQRGIDPNMTFCDVYSEGSEKALEVAADCNISTPLLHYLNTFLNIVNPVILDLLIEYGADVNIQNDSGETLLHVLAAQLPLPEGRISEVGARLIANGADIDARDRQGKTVLETALCAEVPSHDFVAHLLDNGADIEALNAESLCNTTLLHLAARVNHPDLAEFALARGIQVNAEDANGQLPLHDLRGPAAGKVLIANGADVNAQNGSGQTPLESAICLHSGWVPLKSEVIAWLLENGANSQSLPLDVGCGSLLTQAIGIDSVELAEIAIANGTDITVRDNEGRTALHQTGRFNATDVAAMLLAEGADINAVDDDGYTPLHVAAIHRKLEIAQLLIDRGADVNAVDEDGHTPLYEAENLAWDPEFQNINPEARQALVALLTKSGGQI